jgi:hypothetical protein
MAKAKSSKISRTKNKKNAETPVNGNAENTPVTHAERVAEALTSPQPADFSAVKEFTPKEKNEAPKESPASKDATPPLPSAAADLEAVIRQRAYQLYLERGGKPGNPNEDWARAEREILEAFHHRRSA